MDSFLQIPAEIKFLSDYLTDLPHDCIFNKFRVGSGGTTVALRNNEDYIITVPFVSLIENKVAQHKGILGVHGKFKPKEILAYLKDKSKPRKIMVTYDSLCNLMTLVDPQEFRLLVDEMHLLFSNYSFRYDAVQCVLNNYTKFKSYCFMTATVLEKEFILKELKDVPTITAKWVENFEVTVHSMKCKKSVVPTVSNIITQFLDGRMTGNGHFFVNSVEFIKELVQLLKLDDTNTRAVFSKYNKTNIGLKLSSTTDAPKKINFYTATCFEGCDLYDEEGRIYIISDKSKSHTLLDISTSFTQIASRIRNTKYWEHIGHIFTTTRYDIALTYNEYKVETQSQIVIANRYSEQLNGLDEGLRVKLELTPDNYVSKRNTTFIFDENLVKLDLYNFKVTRCIYKFRVNLNKEYQRNNLKSVDYDSLIKDDFEISNVFKEVVIECQKQDPDYLIWAYNKYDFLQDAFKYLGFEKMEALNFHMGNIKKTTSKFNHKPHNEKIKSCLSTYKEIGIGLFVSSKRLKDIFNETYDNLEIVKIPKATDLQEYYNIKETVRKVKGISEKGYIVMNEKH